MLIAKNGKELHLLPEMSNRHGVITGNSGSGKTVTLRVMAENFSKIGVPVFMSDIKGDLNGLDIPGRSTPEIEKRVQSMNIKDFSFEGSPTRCWDVYGEEGEEIKTAIDALSPLLLSRLLNLSDVQNESLAQLFKIVSDYSTDTNKIEVKNIEDMTTVINEIIENSDLLEHKYGRISKPSFASIQRSMLMLEQNGKDVLFSDTPFNVQEFMKTQNGRGVINIFRAKKLFENPTVYATFLLWLIAELYKTLPECGDIDKPKIVFFFDEAHLLFDDAPKILVDNVEKLVRLIRSKGVGVFFISQSPSDIPDKVLGQLGNRVQHSLRAFTPKEQKAVRTAAQTFRNDRNMDVEKAIGILKIGEALISFLDESGAPTSVTKALVCPPRSSINAHVVVPTTVTKNITENSNVFDSII